MTTPFPFVASTVLTAAQMNAITTLPIETKTASYTAIVGDVGKRIVMNVASANTLTINNSIFAEGDTIFVGNKGAGATTITAGAGVTINPAASLAVAQYGGGTLVALSASVFNFFSGAGSGYGVATGGSSSSITVNSINYTLLTFTTDSNLVVSTAGLFDVLIFGAGGGGGSSGGAANTGAGGGAGGAQTSTVYLSAATYAVDVGAGGATYTNGLGSAIGTAVGSIASGGGGFGSGAVPLSHPGIAGGGSCGGGQSAADPLTRIGLAGVNGITGFNGGTCTYQGNASAGGGGAGALGANGVSSTGGAGGAGIEVNTFISGSSLFKGGGGGGGGATGGAGGSSVGGAGGTGNANGGTASANTAGGGGGGGSTTSNLGGAGGSGIVYVRFKV